MDVEFGHAAIFLNFKNPKFFIDEGEKALPGIYKLTIVLSNTLGAKSNYELLLNIFEESEDLGEPYIDLKTTTLNFT